MPVKIKINWDNENIVSESVRIYRSDSTFTPENLPRVLEEIVGDVYEYEDLTTIEDETYFYMLSAKLGEQEVFTECFEVLAGARQQKKLSYVAGLRQEQSGGALSASIPPHNTNDLIVVVVQAWVSGITLPGFTLGYSYKNTNSALETYFFYKIASEDQVSNTIVASTAASGSTFSMIFRPDGGIVEASILGAGRTVLTKSGASRRADSPTLSLSVNGETGFEIVVMRNGGFGASGVTSVTHAGTKTLYASRVYPSAMGIYFNMAVFGNARTGTTSLTPYSATFGGLPGSDEFEMQGITTFISAK